MASQPSPAQPEPSQPDQQLLHAIRQHCLLLVVAADGRVQEANDLLLERLGRSEKAVLGSSLAELLAGGSGATSADTLIDSILAGGFGTGLLCFRAKDDGMVTASASVHLLGEGKQRTATIVATELHAEQLAALDPRRGAEVLIQERLALIAYAADGSITDVNHHALSLFDCRAEELRGRTEEVLLTSPVYEGEKCQEKWRQLRSGKPVDQLLHVFSQSGQDVFLQAHYQPIVDGEGTTRGFLMLGCDVSPTERRLRKAFAMMEKKSTALSIALQEAREAQQMREEMDRALQAMATPVTPIWDQVLLLPLVGIVDSTRTDDAMKTTLDKISATGAKMFILDISGVPSVDTAVANQLIKITKATKIMGCETIVSGVSSAIAHTIVELGIDIGEMLTTSSLRDAVSISLDRVNNGKKEKKKNKKMTKQAKGAR